MENPSPEVPGKPALWPGLWIPLIILVTGVTVTAIAASAGAGLGHNLALSRYHTQHQSLVNHFLASKPPLERSQVSDWLDSLFDNTVPADLGLRIDSLERHTKQPIFQIRANDAYDPTLALRTEVALDHTRWMITTLPGSSLLDGAANRIRNTIWSIGLIFNALTVMLTLLLCRRLHRQSRLITMQRQQKADVDLQITNLQVEKSTLHQALTDSEQRSRDLIALSGAIIFELDESGCIGFTSPQIADLLGHAPADLIGQPFDVLIAPSSRENMSLAMSATRTEQSVQRIDLSLLHKDEENTVPVVLRLRALQDPLHGFVGYRLSALFHPENSA
jgi:PAS domain S-box-containing protein